MLTHLFEASSYFCLYVISIKLSCPLTCVIMLSPALRKSLQTHKMRFRVNLLFADASMFYICPTLWSPCYVNTVRMLVELQHPHVAEHLIKHNLFYFVLFFWWFTPMYVINWKEKEIKKHFSRICSLLNDATVSQQKGGPQWMELWPDLIFYCLQWLVVKLK